MDEDKRIREFQPLEIYELTDAEKDLLVAALIEGKKRRLVVQARLERALDNRSLRYMLKRPAASEAGHAADSAEAGTRKRERVPVAYEKWVGLYHYVMNRLYRDAVEDKAERLIQIIEELHHVGLKTGRYDNDLHLFNSQYLNQNTRVAGIDERYIGHYVGFRLRSNGSELIAGLMQIYSAEKGGRYVFHAKLADPTEDREVRGTAYELSGHLNLLGFLNDGHGGEYYALCPDNRSHDILYGIMATVNHARIPHAKNCCFIRASRIDGLLLKSSPLIDKKEWSDVQDQIGFIFPTGSLDVPVRLQRPQDTVDLRRYITTDVVFSRNVPQREKLLGPTH